MLLGIYIKNRELVGNPRLAEMEKALVADGNELYSICSREDVRKGTDMVLSVGGDGTFLSASKRVADSGIPILGVNLGRLGFLSENRPEDIPAALKDADYELENRTMLKASLPQTAEVPDSLSFWPYALNEITVHRSGAAMLGIECFRQWGQPADLLGGRAPCRYKFRFHSLLAQRGRSDLYSGCQSAHHSPDSAAQPQCTPACGARKHQDKHLHSLP